MNGKTYAYLVKLRDSDPKQKKAMELLKGDREGRTVVGFIVEAIIAYRNAAMQVQLQDTERKLLVSEIVTAIHEGNSEKKTKEGGIAY